MKIAKLAHKWGWDAGNNFAVACYNNNSITELLDICHNGSNKTDMRKWGVTVEQWYECIAAALYDLRHTDETPHGR